MAKTQRKKIIVLEYVAYITFLIVSFVFVKSIIQEYLQGSTYFSQYKESVSKDDLPTATVCILANKKLIYEQDFWVRTVTPWNDSNWSDPNTTLITLKKGLNEYEFQGKRQTFLKVLKVQQNAGAFSRTCFSMHLGLKGELTWHDHSMFSLLFNVLTFSKNILEGDVQQVRLYLTTKKNSFGAVFSRWFEGEVEALPLTKGGYQSLQVYKIIKYEHLKGTCQDISFYECLASKLVENEKCMEKKKTGLFGGGGKKEAGLFGSGGVKKESGLLGGGLASWFNFPYHCTPYSLPKAKTLDYYRICQTSRAMNQCGEVYKELSHDEVCMKQKPCSIQEYTFRRNNRWSVLNENNKEAMEKTLKRFLNEEVRKQLLDTNNTQYMFWASFLSPQSTRGEYINRVQKDVHKELVSMTGISLIGNVGGQLGLCLGFSFIGFIAWLLVMVPKIFKILRIR